MSERIQWLWMYMVMLWGAFYLHGLGPLVSLEQRFSIPVLGGPCPACFRTSKKHQYKVVLTDPLDTYDKTLLSWWEWSLPGWQFTYPLVTRGHWMVWWLWRFCKSYAFAVIRHQPSWTPMGALSTTIIKEPTEGISFIKWCPILPVELQRLIESVH